MRPHRRATIRSLLRWPFPSTRSSASPTSRASKSRPTKPRKCAHELDGDLRADRRACSASIPRASSRWRTPRTRCCGCARTAVTETDRRDASRRRARGRGRALPRAEGDRVGGAARAFARPCAHSHASLRALAERCARSAFPASSSRGAARPHRALNAGAERFITVDRERASRGASAADARIAQRRRRAADRHSDRAQGHL